MSICANVAWFDLEGGNHGSLAPVGDDPALAKAILSLLDAPPDPEQLRTRAADFSVDMSAHRYLELLLESGV